MVVTGGDMGTAVSGEDMGLVGMGLGMDMATVVIGEGMGLVGMGAADTEEVTALIEKLIKIGEYITRRSVQWFTNIQS